MTTFSVCPLIDGQYGRQINTHLDSIERSLHPQLEGLITKVNQSTDDGFVPSSSPPPPSTTNYYPYQLLVCLRRVGGHEWWFFMVLME